MKKILIVLAFILSLNGVFGQVKISDMPEYIGNPSNVWVPVITSGVNRKMNGFYFASNKVDSVWLVGNVLYFKKNTVTNSYTIDTAALFNQLLHKSDSTIANRVTNDRNFLNASLLLKLDKSDSTIANRVTNDRNFLNTSLLLKLDKSDSTIANRVTNDRNFLNASLLLKLDKSDSTIANRVTNDRNFLNASLTLKVDKTTTINSYPLSSNITLTKSDIGLSNVDNTSDINKPISTAQQAALNLKKDKSDSSEASRITANRIYTDALGATKQNKLVNGNNIDTVGNLISLRQFSTIYQGSFFSSYGDFTATGFTPTINNSAIRLTSGAGDFNQYLILNNSINDDENVEYEMVFKAVTLGYGIGIGWKSVNTYANQSLYYQLNTLGDSVQIYNGALGTITAFKMNIVISANDICRVRLQRFATTFILTFEDLTAKTSFTNTLVSTYSNFPLPNASKPVIFNFNGTFDVMSFKVTSRTNFNPDVLVVGDSKTAGWVTSSPTMRFGWLLQKLGVCQIYAGGGDRTVELVQHLDYIIKIRPKYVVLCIGRNDLAAGVSSATWQANYQTIVTTLTNAGITVIHLYGLNETVQNQSALTSWINSTYSTNKLDISGSWSNSLYLYSDNVHPNDLGNAYIASQIVNSGLIPLKTNPIAPIYWAEIGGSSSGGGSISGTVNNIVKFGTSSTGVNSAISESGSVVTISGTSSSGVLVMNQSGAGNFSNTVYNNNSNTKQFAMGLGGTSAGIGLANSFFLYDGTIGAVRYKVSQGGRFNFNPTGSTWDTAFNYTYNGNQKIVSSVSPVLSLVQTTSSAYANAVFSNDINRSWAAGVGGTTESAFGVANSFFIHDAPTNVIRLKVSSGGKFNFNPIGAAWDSTFTYTYNGTSKFTTSNTSTATAQFEQTTSNGYANNQFINNIGSSFSLGVGGSSETAYGVSNSFFLFDVLSSSMRLKVSQTGKFMFNTTTDSSSTYTFNGSQKVTGITTFGDSLSLSGTTKGIFLNGSNNGVTWRNSGVLVGRIQSANANADWSNAALAGDFVISKPQTSGYSNGNIVIANQNGGKIKFSFWSGTTPVNDVVKAQIDTSGNITSIANIYSTNYTTTTGPITLTAANRNVNVNGSSHTVTLPSASGNTGLEFWLVNTSGGTPTISTYTGASGSQSNIPIGKTLHLVSDGTNWINFEN